MSPLIMRSCAEFAQRGYEVELWIPRRHNPQFGHVDAHTFHHVQHNFSIRRLWTLDWMHVLPTAFPFLLMVATFNISVWWRAWRQGAQDTVFFSHDQRDTLLLALLRSNIVYEIHDFYYSNVQFINNLTFKRAAGFVVTNTLKIDIIHRDFDIPYEKMAHEPNAVDVNKFAINTSKAEARTKLDLPTDQHIALYTGHLFDWKGVHTLAQSAAFLPANTYIYFVGGTVEDRKALQEFIKKTVSPEHSKHIVFLPHQEHAKIPLFFRAADVLVLPNTGKVKTSAIETSPVKLFEYLASGRPIAASDLPSIRNIVDEKSVYFFTPDDAQSMAQTIALVLEDARGAQEKIVVAQKLVEHYTWDKRFDRVVDFLKKIA